MTQERGKRKVIKGTVVSDKMRKTIVVEVERKYRHSIYGKIVKGRTNFKVHNPEGKARTGDFVEIMETKPISKDKRWRLVNIIQSSIKSEDLSKANS